MLPPGRGGGISCTSARPHPRRCGQRGSGRMMELTPPCPPDLSLPGTEQRDGFCSSLSSPPIPSHHLQPSAEPRTQQQHPQAPRPPTPHGSRSLISALEGAEEHNNTEGYKRCSLCQALQDPPVPGEGTGQSLHRAQLPLCALSAIPQISPSHNEISRTAPRAAALLSILSSNDAVTHSVHIPMDVHVHCLVFVAIKQPTGLWRL